jgi:hypothetical protein
VSELLSMFNVSRSTLFRTLKLLKKQSPRQRDEIASVKRDSDTE